MELMGNRIRPYAWGSRTAIAELIGTPSPAPHPQAELWMGAHPGDSSTLLDAAGERSLLDAITDKPVLMLGERVEREFGPRLPFLMKVLAAAEPLSLQAHPSAAQAARGFALEEATGVPMKSSGRNYKDGNHKPELICALTVFDALCGFREPVRTVRLLADLAVPQLDHYLSLLSGQPDADGVRALFSSILTIPSSMLDPLLTAVLAACVRLVREGSPFFAEYRTALELGERYPGDPGVLASLLLNRVTLQPGQALYLPAGNLHAYLAGVGVELMANSDNVLRGGLTPKHVDVPELMRVLDFSAGDVEVLSGDAIRPGELVYRAPAPEFRLSRLTVTAEPLDITHDGPQVVLVVAGSATVTDGEGRQIVLERGRSVWVAAGDTGVVLRGSGVAFRATDGLVAA
jgi:mannose-6-phosphate isomerase